MSSNPDFPRLTAHNQTGRSALHDPHQILQSLSLFRVVYDFIQRVKRRQGAFVSLADFIGS
jgi:hypothetical protein